MLPVSTTFCARYPRTQRIQNFRVQTAFNIPTKKFVIQALLAGMLCHQKDHILTRNGILALWQLKSPEDCTLLYEDVVDVLLLALRKYAFKLATTFYKLFLEVVKNYS